MIASNAQVDEAATNRRSTGHVAAAFLITAGIVGAGFLFALLVMLTLHGNAAGAR